MGIGGILLAAIALAGVTGDGLRARAFFDAHNVKVGDPMILTIDFIGTADFAALHPPRLAREVDRRVWRVDDTSAKTDTFRDARRLTYRVRPLADGVLWFPELVFSYSGVDGRPREVSTRAMPVHAVAGEQVVVAEMSEDFEKMPQPDALHAEPGVTLSDDESFAWRKACARPSADAFAAFDFPVARFNEAACALRDGNWARALKIYRRLEWTVGQTPELERGLVAVEAARTQNPAAELNIWRQVARPLLRYGWKGRAGCVSGALAALALVFFVLGRVIRRLAVWVLLVALGAPLASPAAPQNGFFNFSFGGFPNMGFAETPKVELKATFEPSRDRPRVGENFEFILTVEAPKSVAIEQMQITPVPDVGLRYTADAYNLPDAVAANPSNVLKRIAVPVRYDVPYRGRLSFVLNGMVTVRIQQKSANRSFTMQSSTSFQTRTPERAFAVAALENAPADFSGIVADSVLLRAETDLKRVHTNDVVTISYVLDTEGYVPADLLPEGCAYEWSRGGRTTVWRRYFVADGAARLPRLAICYYDPKSKTFRRATAGGESVVYE